MVDDQVKRELLSNAAPPVVTTILRVGISNYYENKRLKQRENFEVRMAEHKTSALQSANDGDPGGGASSAFADPDPVNTPPPASESDDPLSDAIEVADELDQRISQAKERETCGFCEDVLDGLEHEDLETQRQGLRELRELQAVMYSDPSRDEIDQTMGRLEVVPKMIL